MWRQQDHVAFRLRRFQVLPAADFDQRLDPAALALGLAALAATLAAARTLREAR